jgi:hypothetical protein
VLPLTAAYPFGKSHGLAEEVADIERKTIKWEYSYTSSVRRGYIVNLFEEKGILNDFIKQYWPEGTSEWGKRKIRFWKNLVDRYAGGNTDENQTDADIEADEEEEFVRAFAAESHLRDFLAANPDCIEPGLKLFNHKGQRGVEFLIDGGRGRIDLLLVDTENRLVVVELKVERGRNKTVGQLAYYMAWVNENLTKTPCRGIIVAKEISTDLRMAATQIDRVKLLKYCLDVKLEQI